MKKYEIGLWADGKAAGKIGFYIADPDSRWNINFHILVDKESRQWGYCDGWWNGPMHYFGLGPLLLIVIMT